LKHLKVTRSNKYKYGQKMTPTDK